MVFWVRSQYFVAVMRLTDSISCTVVGTNNATKHLAQFLSCTKEYRAIGLLGCSTDSYDSEGKRMELKPYEHITREMVEGILDRYRGDIEQIPPM